MEWQEIIKDKTIIGILSSAVSVSATILAQYLLNKRAIFSFNTIHNRVGLSTEDAIYGSVKVTWNGNPVNHLFLSSVEIKNESFKDYDAVIVRIFSNDTLLLTQRTQIVGTTRTIDFTNEYSSKINVMPGQEPTQDQFNLHRTQRDYFVPTMNRHQILRFEFLNAAKTDKQPSIWVDILHKGVICKFNAPSIIVLGVPQQPAAIVGTIFCLGCVLLIVIFINNLYIASFTSFFLGWLALIPGAFIIKLHKKLKEFLAG